MGNLYGVHGGPSIFAVVKANSEEEAIHIFAKNQINDELLKEEIDSFIVNSSLLEKFYKDENGHFFDDFTGDYDKRLLSMESDEREEYIQQHIERNVREFWKATPEHAETYLKELNKYLEQGGEGSSSFSEEFYVETIKLIIDGGNWYEDFGVIKIEMSQKEFQVIYRD